MLNFKPDWLEMVNWINVKEDTAGTPATHSQVIDAVDYVENESVLLVKPFLVDYELTLIVFWS